MFGILFKYFMRMYCMHAYTFILKMHRREKLNGEIVMQFKSISFFIGYNIYFMFGILSNILCVYILNEILFITKNHSQTSCNINQKLNFLSNCYLINHIY